MRLLSLSFANFKTVGERQRLNLSRRGLVCVVGENGAGKTTIEDAIVWCLEGRTLSGMKGNDVVNEFTGRDCHVRLRFQDSRKTLWVVDRYRKHKKFRNKLFLKQKMGNQLVDRSHHMMEETEEEIRKLTRLDFTSLVVSMVVGQGVLAPFSAMTTSEQSRVLDIITGNDVVQTALEVTRQRKSSLNSEFTEIAQEVTHAKHRLEDAQREYQEARDSAKQEKKQREERLRKLKGNEREAMERLARARVELEGVRGHQKRVKALQKRLEPLQEAYQEWDTKRATTQVELKRLEVRVNHYERVHKKIGAICDECGSEISRDTVDKLYSDALTDEAKAEDAYKAACAKVKKIRARWEALANTIKELEKKTKTSLSVEDCDWQVKAIRMRISEENDVQSTWVKATTRSKQRVVERRQKLKAKRKELKRVRRQLAYVAHIEQEYARDIPLDIQDSSLPFLNKKAARYSKIITDGYVDIEFATEKENKGGNTKEGICVLARNVRGGSKYLMQSKGEKQKIDLVVASSLQALSTETARSSVNVAFYDEPFDALDPASVERVMQFLQEELKHRESVFVITHNTALQSHFSNTIQVSKPQDSSVIMEV